MKISRPAREVESGPSVGEILQLLVGTNQIMQGPRYPSWPATTA